MRQNIQRYRTFPRRFSLDSIHKIVNDRGKPTVPKTDVIFYADADGTAPALEWLEDVPDKARDKLLVRIERLEEKGHELRRPEADLLRDKIYELRVRHQQVNYRLLYFFHGQVAAVLAHGCTKEAAVPPAEIDRAVRRRRAFLGNPARHTYSAADE
jgi:phage-related protein